MQRPPFLLYGKKEEFMHGTIQKNSLSYITYEYLREALSHTKRLPARCQTKNSLSYIPYKKPQGGSIHIQKRILFYIDR